MMSYENPPHSDEDITTVSLVTTNLPLTTTTIDHRSKRMLVTVVAGLAGTMMLVVAGGVVRRLKTNDAGLTMTAAGGPVVATLADIPCLPAPDTFSGITETAGKWVWSGHKHPFETCYQYGDTAKYCWSHSYYQDNGLGWFPCLPAPYKSAWHSVGQENLRYVNPITHPYSCGPPCQEMYQQ